MGKDLEAGIVAPAVRIENKHTTVSKKLLKMLELRVFPEPRPPEMSKRLAMPVS